MAQLPDGVKVTWFGHSTFRITTPSGANILIDPWVMGNPACPDELKDPGDLDGMLITHPHFDHIGDAVEIIKDKNPQVVAIAETAGWLQSKTNSDSIVDMNRL